MKIAVGSTNPVKIEATKKAFRKVWQQKSWQIIGADISSKVSNQPMSDIESITGATNRAKGAIKKAKADFGVGIEGGLQKVGSEWFDCGWVVVIDKEGRTGIGSSIKMHTPKKIMKMVKNGKELGVVDDVIFKTKNSKQNLGHFGLMTKGKLTRSEAYTQAIICALARFITPEVFE